MGEFVYEKGLRVNKFLCFINLRSATLFLLWVLILTSFYLLVMFVALTIGPTESRKELIIGAGIFLCLTIISTRTLMNMPAPDQHYDEYSTPAKALRMFTIFFELFLLLVILLNCIIILKAAQSVLPQLALPSVLSSIISVGLLVHIVAVVHSYYMEVITMPRRTLNIHVNSATMK